MFSMDKLFVLDGGFASELERDGGLDKWSAKDNPLWSSAVLPSNPASVLPVHSRFLAAGADIIESNTYHCSLDTLQRQGHSLEAAKEICKSGVTWARTAITQFQTNMPADEKRPILLAGSIGPYGVNLCDGSEYNGHYMNDTDHKTITEYHEQQARVLLEAGCDFLTFETLPSRQEARCILDLLDRLPTRAWISFSCNSATTTCAGDDFAASTAECAAHERVVAVGINCTDPELITPLLRAAQPTCKPFGKPFVVYPNSGELYEHDKGFYANPEVKSRSWSNYINEWIPLGGRIFGGCCRVYADDIANIAEVVKECAKDF